MKQALHYIDRKKMLGLYPEDIELNVLSFANEKECFEIYQEYEIAKERMLALDFDDLLLKTLVILIAPFAPHIAEELWEALGEQGSVCDSQWPTWNEEYLVENSVKMGIAFNGKTRFDMEFPADASNDDIQQSVLADERAAKYVEGFDIKKVIIVPKRMVNIVLGK
jgi:leucyl-tRNA synthetase